MHEVARDLVLLLHHGDGLARVIGRAALTSALRVGGERLLELVGESKVVDHEAARFVAEHSVHPGDRLHEAVPLHRLVGIHRVQAGRIKACQPHVAHDHDPERILRVLEPIRQLPPLVLAADVRLPVRAVVGAAGHHHFHHAGFAFLGLGIVVRSTGPVGTMSDQGVVEINADPTTHTDDHGLAFHRLHSLLEMLHQVLGNEFDALRVADQSLQCRPLGLELLLLGELLALRDLIELLIELRQCRCIQRQLRDPAFVIDRHRRLIRNRPLDVVDRNVVAKNRPGVCVRLFDRRAGKSDKRRIGQRIAQVSRQAIDQIVLAAVRFIRDDDDVAAIRQGDEVPSGNSRSDSKLVNRGEYNAATRPIQQLPQLVAPLGLDRRLPQNPMAALELTKQLVVEIVAIRQYHQRRILHRRMTNHLPRVKEHREALP